MPLELSWIDLSVEDLVSHKIEQKKKIRAHSYVSNMINALWYAMASGVNSTSATGNIAGMLLATDGLTTAGNATGFMPGSLACNVAAGAEWRGIVVGTGNTAVAISNYQLATKINEGVGAGQLLHGAGSSTTPATVSSTRRVILTRTFTNNSGGSITVNECGIYAAWFISVSEYRVMVARDIISGGVAVADGKVLTIQYTIGVTA